MEVMFKPPPRNQLIAITSKSKISAILIFLCSFIFLIRSCMAEDIPLGSILLASNPNQTWSSPSNSFSLHFLPVTASSYSLAITYASSLPIWSARAASVVTAVDSGGSFQLLPNGDLQLLNGSSTVVWRSNTSNLGVSHATLDDSGNLILRNNKSVSLWSSFQHPTDTVVPSQNFTTQMSLTSGLYSFEVTAGGNLTLIWNQTITYWTRGLNSSVNNVSLQNPSLGITSIGILNLYDLNLPTSAVMAYSSDYVASDVTLRLLKLDGDGNLRIYSSKGTSSVDVRWTAVLDQCEVFGYCGNMGVCSYNDTSPICGCPSLNFDPVDPNDTRQGCRRKLSIQNCSGSPSMLEMDHTRFLTYTPEINNDLFSEGIEPCRSNCLVSSTCVASTALADGTGFCYQKVEGFVSAYQSAALPSTSFVKICGTASPNPPPSSQDARNSKKLRAWIVVLVVLATLVSLALVESALWWWCCRKMHRFGGLSAQYALLEYASGAPVQFTYRELQRATKGFKEKLGAGGFGAVYRGVLTNRTVVAVKQLEGIEQGEKQFRMEVATISSTHHLNLVRLIGFCSEGRHRLLVYEFMKNGSLDSFLFGGSHGESEKQLSWENRFSVALGTARGITYLHEECRDCIVHCDIKPENILLDDNCNAKVSDFGLAKLINPKDQRYRTLTSLRGTRGYLAPEWLANLPITLKSDVYSYGMVLLEIVSGKRNFEVSAETNSKKFTLWAYEEFERGNPNGIVDKELMGDPEVDMEQIMRAIKVSFWCIQEQPSQRPMMGKVVQMLEGVMEIDKPPAPNTIHIHIPIPIPEGSSSSISSLSTVVASAPAPSSSSSFQTPRARSFSAMNVEKPTSVLIVRESRSEIL